MAYFDKNKLVMTYTVGDQIHDVGDVIEDDRFETGLVRIIEVLSRTRNAQNGALFIFEVEEV